MSGHGNGNGNGGGNGQQSALEAVAEHIAARNLESDPPRYSESESDPLYAWKSNSAGQPVTLQQIHTGLLSVSQIAEASIEIGVRTSADIKHIASALTETAAQLRSINADLVALHSIATSARREVQYMKDDLRETADKVAMVPTLKEMLRDVLVRLPD